MDIYAKRGHKVMANYVDGKICGGHDYQAEQAERVLKEGEVYTVDYTEVGGWSTDVVLIEFPDMIFNSCLFKNCNWCQKELDKITNHKDFHEHGTVFKIRNTPNTVETLWVRLDDESASTLVEWLKQNYNITE